MNSGTYLSEVTGSVHRADNSVLRERVAYWPTDGRIRSVHDLKAAIRCADRAYGGYSALFTTYDGDCLCAQCVRDNLAAIFDSVSTRTNDGWRVNGAAMECDVEDMRCGHCGAPIGHQSEEQD